MAKKNTTTEQDVASNYGIPYAVIQAFPQLAKWFSDFAARYVAADGKISQQRFTLELQQQPDWKQHSATFIADMQQELENPADYAQALQSSVSSVQAAADQMGARLSSQDATDLAKQAKRFGWNAQQMQAALAKYVTVNPASDYLDYEGDAGTTQDELASWAHANGLGLSDSMVSGYINQIAAGKTTLDEVKSDLRKTYMAGAFPAWADKINAGMDIADIAAPYKSTMANLLEMDDSAIDFNDPLLAAGLQSVNKDGQPQVMPLYQYQNLARKDPRWQKTDNAYATYAGVASDILGTWGFR